MRKDMFWKVVSILFIAWLFLWLWSNRYLYMKDGFIKINKITGKMYVIEDGEWRSFKEVYY